MLWVIDASIAAKWFLPELHKESAEKLLRDYLSDTTQFIAPDILIAEVGNIFWKRSMHLRDITEAQAAESYSNFLALDIPLHPSSQLASAALQFAMKHRRPIYDMTYLALAEQRGCEFVTADERLVNALKETFPCLRWIGSI